MSGTRVIIAMYDRWQMRWFSEAADCNLSDQDKKPDAPAAAAAAAALEAHTQVPI
jgi:hypothetical protein